METESHVALEYVIGDVVIFNSHEWIIVEIDEDQVLLYRDGIDGRSRTLTVSKSQFPQKFN